METPLYWVITLVVLLAALLVFAIALRMLWSRHWLFGWLRGCIGLLLLAGAVGLALAGWDLHRYRALTAEQPVATLAFTRLQPQHYQVSLVDPDGAEQRFELYGDLWQLDVRMIKWHPRLAQVGVSPGYQLERISGRYFVLEQEQTAPRSVHGLSAPAVGLDTWKLLRTWKGLSGWVDARYGSATYLPMADGAMFAVNIGISGLVARPLNERAREAIDAW